MTKSPKPVVWLGDTLDALRTCPLKGFGAGVLEVIADHRGDTYRAVYTVRFAERVYVLHLFQEKSKKGIATPQSEIELVRQRLQRAAELDRKRER